MSAASKKRSSKKKMSASSNKSQSLTRNSKTGRFEFRVKDSVRAKVEKAAALKNSNLSEYVSSVIERDAEKVIQEHERITLKDDIFDRFIAACDSAKSANDKLASAAERYKDEGYK